MVNFKQISHIILVFPLLTLNKQMPVGQVQKQHFRSPLQSSCSKKIIEWISVAFAVGFVFTINVDLPPANLLKRI